MRKVLVSVVVAGLPTLCGVLALPAAAAAAITPTLTEFPILTPKAQPTTITTGPDGNLWFLEDEKPGGIAKISTAGAITQVATGGVTPGFAENSTPAGITAGPDGNLWFVEQTHPAVIARVSPATGAVTPVASIGEPGVTADSRLDPIASGPDGNLWVTEDGSPHAISRVTPSGALTQFHTMPAIERFAVTAGPDGNLWFTAANGSAGAIGRISPLTGAIAEFSAGLTAGGLFGIAAGPAGDVWFTESANPGKIGAITPEGAIAELASGGTSPGFSANSEPHDLVEGPDGYLWFTEASEPSGPGRIGRLNPATGTVEEFPLPTAASAPDGIALGADGNLWFTERGADNVGRITTPPAAATMEAGAAGTSFATVTGLVAGHAQPTSFHIEYGELGGAMTTTPEQPLGVSTAVTPVSALLSGLAANTVYQARVVATNPTGIAAAGFVTFVTARSPFSLPLVLSGVHESARRWREGPRRPRISAGHGRRDVIPVGTTFSFLLNERAAVTFAFTQRVSGRKVRGRCVAATPHNEGRRGCSRTVTPGRLMFTGHPRVNRVRFEGIISGSKKLNPGAYALVITATNGAGQQSAPQGLGFTIVK
jgi:streptogramin lyase